MPKGSIRCLVLVILIVQAFVLAGCQAFPERSQRVADDWSRGVHLGHAAISGKVGLAIDQLAENIYLVWVAEETQQGEEFLRFVRLDRRGHVSQERDLRIGADRPTQVEIVVDESGHLHLTWLDRVAGVRRLFYARLDPSGRLASYPRPISLPRVMVESYAVGPGASGGIELFWGAKEGEQAGLYHVQLDKWGETEAENLDLGVKGFDPAFRTDRHGISHLVWLDEPDYGEHYLRYATFDGKRRALSPSSQIARFAAPTGLVAHRPSLGLAGDDVYIFWSLERRGGGFSRPSAHSLYVAFPSGRPDMAGKPRRVHIPPLNQPKYEMVKSQFQIRDLATAAQSPAYSDFIYLPWTNQGHYDELVTAFAVQLVGRTKGIVQVVLALWSDGELKGYQIVGKTRSSSLRPMLVADASGDLHLAWIDTAGFGSYAVYYAGTDPEARANLNRVTGRDLAAAALNFVWSIVQALSLFPVALIWVFPPLMLLAVYSFIRAEGDLSRLGSRVMLVVAALVYTGFKYLFRPGWLAAIRLPHGLASIVVSVVTYSAPLVISALAGVAAWTYAKHREFPKLLPAFGVFAGSDALITLLVYAPGILGE